MPRPVDDPNLKSAKREALVALAIFVVALVYSVGYCYRFGYGRTVESLTFVFGVPDWVFWGIVMPWIVAIGITCWFTFGFMSDDPLSQDIDELTTEAPDEGHDHA